MNSYRLKAIKDVDDMNEIVYALANKHIEAASNLIEKNRHLLDLSDRDFESGEVKDSIRTLYDTVRREATKTVGDYKLPREITEEGRGWICLSIAHLKSNMKFYEHKKHRMEEEHNRKITQNLRDMGFVA